MAGQTIVGPHAAPQCQQAAQFAAGAMLCCAMRLDV